MTFDHRVAGSSPVRGFRFCSVTVSTVDFESTNPSSNLGRTSIRLYSILLLYPTVPREKGVKFLLESPFSLVLFILPVDDNLIYMIIAIT